MNNFLKKLKYLLPLVGSFLATLAGQGFKYLRRVVLPIILSIVGVICLESAWGIILGMSGIFFSCGYGIPDSGYPSNPNADSGSTLGRFFWNLVNKNHRLADILTRTTLGIGFCLTAIVIPIITQNWVLYGIGCFCILLGQSVFSYLGLGYIKWNNIELLYSDLINYGLMGLGYLVMLS